MSPTATLIIIERVVGAPNADPNGKFFDLNMLVQYGALERTRQEFQASEGQRLRDGRDRPNPLRPEYHRRATPPGSCGPEQTERIIFSPTGQICHVNTRYHA